MNDKAYKDMNNTEKIQFMAGVWYNPACTSCGDDSGESCETCDKRGD